MAGIFDFFGGGSAPAPGLLDAAGYMDPAQYDAARRSQSMMGLWAGLLQGGGPSLEPRNFGSALGAGLVGQQKFGSTFDEDQLRAAQAAEGRANVPKRAAETEAQRAAIKLLGEADQIPAGMLPPGAPGAPAVPNFGAGTGGGGGGWGPHASIAIETLKAAGYSDAAIQGIMANGLGEGGFKTNWQKSGFKDENSFGHWQFNERGELPGLREFAKAQGGDPTDTRIQALYVAKRAEEVYPGFSKLTDPKAATDIFLQKFERPKNAQTGSRYGLLADAQRYMAGTPVEERQPIPAGPGGYAGPVPGGAIPEFAGGRAAALGGPVPAAVAGGPAAPVPGPLAGAPSGNRPGSNLPATGPGLVTPQDYEQWMARQRGAAAGGSGGGPPMLPPDADYGGGGDDAATPTPFPPAPWHVAQQAAAAAAAAPPAGAPPAVPVVAAPVPMPGEGGPSLAPGGVFSPAAQAIAAGAPPVPAAAVAPAPPIPPAPPVAAAAPAPAALAPPARPAIPAAPPVAPMPGAVAPAPLPAAQAPPAGGAQPYNPQAHRAQLIAQALTLMGKTVPAHIAEAAALPLAGQKAALEAAAKQPYLMQMEAYKQMGELQRTQYAHQLGIDKSLLDNELARYNDTYGKGGVYNPQTGRVEPVPGMSETQAAAAGAKAAAEDAGRRTADQKEYDSYAEQETSAGRTPLSQFEYQQNLKRSGAASTVINTAEGLAAAQQRARLDIDTKAAKDAGEIAAAARRTAPLLDEVLRIAHSTPSGWAGPISVGMSRALSAAGLPVTEGMSNAEVMRSMNQLLIPTVREPGSSSNADVNNYLAATPGLMNSPEGRVKMASMIKAMGARAGEIAAIYRNNVGAADLHEKLAALDAKPLFTEQQRADIAQAAGGGVTKRNPDGSWTTPSGAIVREVR